MTNTGTVSGFSLEVYKFCWTLRKMFKPQILWPDIIKIGIIITIVIIVESIPSDCTIKAPYHEVTIQFSNTFENFWYGWVLPEAS